MKTGRLVKNGVALVETVEIARGLIDRMRGLLGRRSLGPGRGMLIVPCASIHTFGMAFALDVAFLDRAFTVVSVVRNVGPHRIVSGGRRARAVLELETGWLPADALTPGDALTLES